jgi:UDP-2-acetamido-3-amino-2,3-dideoxy-glucuronate N-acetyltransferase
MMPRGRIALLGVGKWGTNLLRVLADLEAIGAVLDQDPRALDRVPASLRAASLDAVLSDPRIQGVVIATPAATHYELARVALLANKDVFVEKPLTLDVAEGADLVEIADRLGRVLMVGHVTLYHPAILELKDRLRRGELGRPQYLYSNRLNSGRVRETENILWSFAPHDFAVLIHLLDASPVEVLSVGSSHLREGRADVTLTHLRFPGGERAHIFVSWLHPMREHRLVVTGERRMAHFADDDRGGSLTLYDIGVGSSGERSVRPSAAAMDVVTLQRNEPLRLEVAHFLECIDRRAEPLTGGRHGLEVVRLLAAADQSLKAGGVPISLPSPQPTA